MKLLGIVISTCDERLVRHGVSLDDAPVHGELPPGDHLHHVAPLHQLHVHLLLTAGPQPPLGSDRGPVGPLNIPGPEGHHGHKGLSRVTTDTRDSRVTHCTSDSRVTKSP